MNLSSNEISSNDFRDVAGEDVGAFSLDSQTRSVLMELDGTKSLEDIAKKTGIGLPALPSIVGKLLQLELVESDDENLRIVDHDFFDSLINQFSFAVGPVAALLIEDAISDLGEDIGEFTTHQAVELVEVLSSQIEREDKRNTFKINMINEIIEKGPGELGIAP